MNFILLAIILSIVSFCFSVASYLLSAYFCSKNYSEKEHAVSRVKRLKRKLNHIQCKIDYLENEVIYQEGKHNEK